MEFELSWGHHTRENTGIALVMVILILAGLLAIAVPLVYICRSNETSAARTLDHEIARRYALSALELAKGQLRRGTYENEFHATYPPPTAAPTPTPANAANLAPYNTPDYDAGPELIVPQAELDKAIPKILPNGDTLSVSVEVEDEQGKLNLNSITPRLLRGLYMAVFRIDAMAMSADDRAALKARFEHLIDPIAMLRFSSGSYTPLRSVEQIRNFSTTDSGTTYQLTETEYEAMRPFLTVHSWRPSEDGFVGYAHVSFIESPSLDHFVGSFDCLYRAEYLDESKTALKTYFVLSKQVPNTYGDLCTVISMPERAPADASYCSLAPEAFHPVNVNSASFTVLLAVCLAPLEIDNPTYSLSDALACARGVKAVGRVRSIAANAGGYDIELTADSDDFGEKTPSLVACDGYYFNVLYVDATHLKSTDDLSGLAATSAHPLDISTVIMNPAGLHSVSPLGSYLSIASRSLFSLVSYDVFTIRSECSLRMPEGLERAQCTVTECVSVGGPRSDDSSPLTLDNVSDFTKLPDAGYSAPSVLDPQKCRISSGWMLDKSRGAAGLLETAPPSFWLTPSISSIAAHSDLASTLSGLVIFTDIASTGRKQFPGPFSLRWDESSMEYHSGFRSGEGTLSYIDPTSYRKFRSTGLSTGIHAIDLGTPFFSFIDLPLRGNLAIGGWFKAHGWEPSSDNTMHRLFTLQPPTSGVTGSTQLYINEGMLSLRVEDDSGIAGTFSYRLTSHNFPPDTWMYIVCHIGGNQQGQCSIFVDNRPVPVEYSTTAPRDGYCLRLAGGWPCTFPVITIDVDADPATLDVDSTEGYPDSGYFRVDDEVIQYAAKTATSFMQLVRTIGDSQASNLAVGKKLLPAARIQPNSEGWFSFLWFRYFPHRGDEVALIPYEVSGKHVFRISGHDPLKMVLDMDAVRFDCGGHDAYILCAPIDATFSTTLPLAAAVFAYSGTSGALTTGDKDTGEVDLLFFSAPGQFNGFAGDAGFLFLAKPSNTVSRLLENITASATTPRVTFLRQSDALKCFISQVDDEIIGIICDADGNVTMQRGMLGSIASNHEDWTWEIPLDLYTARPLSMDLDATATSYSFADPDLNPASGQCWRIEDEIVFFSPVHGQSPDPSLCHVTRGLFGSVPAAHMAGTIAVQFPCLGSSPYDFDDPNGLQDSCFEFSRTRPGMRISGLTWADLAPDPFVQLHFWADVADDHDFVREPVSPNVFHFTSKSKDFSISRNGEPVLTDSVTVRMMHEYLRGAWLPNDPTRHSWKALPQIDRIELWIQEPDVVFEHREHP